MTRKELCQVETDVTKADDIDTEAVEEPAEGRRPQPNRSTSARRSKKVATDEMLSATPSPSLCGSVFLAVESSQTFTNRDCDKAGSG
jgi:hypothetical protein